MPQATRAGTVLHSDGKRSTGTYGQYLFDCVALFIHCPKHGKIATVRWLHFHKGSFIPIVATRPSETWQEAASLGAIWFLSGGNPTQFLNHDDLSFHQPKLIHILRIEVPEFHKAVTRTTFLVTIKDSWSNCCQPNSWIEWWSVNDIIKGKLPENVWGAEINVFARYLIKDQLYFRLDEFNLERALEVLSAENIQEVKMLKSIGFGQKEMEKLYSDYIQHVYPSKSMTLYSFKSFMTRLNWQQDDPRMPQVFRVRTRSVHPQFLALYLSLMELVIKLQAFNFRRTGFLDFFEFMLGLAAMDDKAEHGGASGRTRIGHIYRYYCSNTGEGLSFDDIVRMLKDIYAANRVSYTEEMAKSEAELRLRMFGIGKDGRISFRSFEEAIKRFRFRGTSRLFRASAFTATSDSIIDTIVGKKIYDKVGGMIGPSLKLARPTRRSKAVGSGTCFSCRPKNYSIGQTVLRLTGGDNKIIVGHRLTTGFMDQEEESKARNKNRTTNLARSFSLEVLFNPRSVPLTILNILRQFGEELLNKPKGNVLHHGPRIEQQLIRDMCLMARETFAQEPRVLKVFKMRYLIFTIFDQIPFT